MPIDPSLLAKSIGTLTDLDPTRDLPAVLYQAVVAAKQLFDADAAGLMLADADGGQRFGRARPDRGGQPGGLCRRTVRAGVRHRQASGHARRDPGAALGEIALTFVEVQIRSGLSVPVELGGGPIGTLDVYAVDPRGWEDSEVSAAQAYAVVVASLLRAAAKAELKGALAQQLQTAPDSRGLIERAKGALMECERLDEQEAFARLRPGGQVIKTQAV